MDIVPVEDSKDLTRFIRVPFEIYRDDPHWVAPLIGDERIRLTPGKNPFFEHGEAAYFLARAGGAFAGRIAASVDRNHDSMHGEKQAAFGFFEARSAEAAASLLAAAEGWARAKGASVARGPLSFTTNDESGLLVEGFGRSQPLMMPYNPPEYAAWIEAAGYRKAKDLYSFSIPGPYAVPATFYRIAEMARRRGKVTTRPVVMKRFDQELGLVKEIYNRAWEKNWGFVPMTEAEIDHMARQLKPAVIPDCVRFAEVEGQAVGVLLYVPDVNLALKPVKGRLVPFGIFRVLWRLPRVREGRLMALGVVQEHRRTGIAPALVADLADVLNRRGYRNSTIGWTLEDNDAVNNMAIGFGCTRSAVHRVYEKSLAG